MTHAYACWTAANASYVIATEALEGDDAVFLATHTPMTGFEVEGTGRAEISTPDEQSLLDAMSSPDRTHAFCVVQGEPGSGKSHLIRWLSIKWPHSNDVKILLRRSDGSLEGALRQLKQRLPAEFESLFANLGQAQRASELGRANVFLGTLAESLEPHHFDPPLDDEAWCEKHQPAALLRHADVRQKWTAPLRILRLLEGAGGNRNSASADFDLLDILDLAKHCYGIHGSGVRPATELLAQRLIKEAEVISEWAAEEYTAEEIAHHAPSAQLRISLELIKALNKRRNHAIQNLLGVSAEGLKALFRKVREKLATRGQRLVLLLEDITSWEGLDDSLIDVLVFNAGARGDEGTADVCPLISVVGLTPAYYDKLQGNYRGRITHEIRLGRVTKELQDVATLRDRTARHGFAARYLAAVRAGPERLAAWASQLAAAPENPRPNLCLGCNKRDECVGTFGEVAGVSLFPFTGAALDRLYDSLKESDKGLTWKTPRGMLQAVLLPSLSEPHRLDEGSYPGVGIEPLPVEDHRRADRVLSANRLGEIIKTKMAESSEQEQSRMRRTFAYWGDPDRADTLNHKGELALAGVSESLLRAFSLPWIGSDRADGEQVAAPERTEVRLPAEGATPAAASQQPGASNRQEEAERSPRPPLSAPTGQRTTSPPKKVPTKSELERLRDELRNWSTGHAITSAAEWNKTIYSLIQSLDAPSLGFPRSVLERIVTQEMVKLEGTTGRQLNYLTVAPEEWIRSGLEAYINLKQGDARTTGDQAFYRMKLAAMMRRLGVLVSDYVEQRLGRTEDGSLWSPVPLLAQVLLARSWLRGTVAPNAPWSEQLRSILEDESVGEGDRLSRSAPWQEWLKGTDVYQGRLRSELRRALDLSLGDGQGIADLSVVSRAMIGLRDDFRFELAPKDAAATSVHEYDIVRELPRAAYELTRICRIEREQLIGRGSRLLALLGGRGIVEHLTQVDGLISEVSAHLSDVAPEKVSDWKRAHTKAQGKQLADAAGRVEAFLMSMDDPAVLSLERSALLGWLAQAPARDLDEFLSLASQGDQVLGALLLSAGDLVRSGGTASLEGIHKVGASLIEAAQKRPTSPESDNG